MVVFAGELDCRATRREGTGRFNPSENCVCASCLSARSVLRHAQPQGLSKRLVAESLSRGASYWRGAETVAPLKVVGPGLCSAVVGAELDYFPSRTGRGC